MLAKQITNKNGSMHWKVGPYMRILTGNAPNCCPCKATGGVKLLYRVHITGLTSSATHFIKKKNYQTKF